MGRDSNHTELTGTRSLLWVLSNAMAAQLSAQNELAQAEKKNTARKRHLDSIFELVSALVGNLKRWWSWRWFRRWFRVFLYLAED